MALDANGSVRGFWSFLCRKMSSIDNVIFYLFSSFQMKRAGTTGSARGMALYEEEVSTEKELKPQSGSVLGWASIFLFSPSLAPSSPILLQPPWS